jgi:ANTAR domain
LLGTSVTPSLDTGLEVSVTEDRLLRTWTRVAREARGATVTLAHVCVAAVKGVRVAGVGVTAHVSPSVWETMHTTDVVAAVLEELQVTVGQGPCLDAFSGGGPVLATDLSTPEYLARWPGFVPAALDNGARAVFAFPLQLGAIRWGAMDLYRPVAGGLSPSGLADALAFAECASFLLLDAAAGTPPDAHELTWQHADPIAHQADVHQATGMLVVQLGVDAEAALARLRAYAYAQDRRLGEVARDVVDRRLRFDADPRTGVGPS